MKTIYLLFLLLIFPLADIFAQKVFIDVSTKWDTADITIDVNYGDSIIIRWVEAPNDTPFCANDVFIVRENFPDTVNSNEHAFTAYINTSLDTFIATGQRNFYIGTACGLLGRVTKFNYLNTGIKPGPGDNGMLSFTNPATHYPTIHFNIMLNNAGITICDITGRTILKQNIPGNNMSIGYLNSGIYFVRVLKDKAQYTRKLIVE